MTVNITFYTEFNSLEENYGFMIINYFIERNSIKVAFCSKWCTGFRSRSPRYYYGKKERPNTGLAEISLLSAEGNLIVINKLLIRKSHFLLF